MGGELGSGAVLAGRYVLDSVIGEGGMGVVWAAHTTSGDRVAIKLVRQRDDGTTESTRRMLREARIASSIAHPNVVRVLEVLELEDGAPAIAMELLEGESLAARLARDPVLALDEAARLLAPVAGALSAAHALGVVHRDLKPENVFLAKRDDGGVDVKVLDFGIAKLTHVEGELAKTAGATSTAGIVGTPCYMSPEQIFGDRDIDHRTDVWSLGIMLYECLTGLLPTNAENVGQVLKVILTRAIWPLADAAPDLPAEVTSLVDRMLSREREGRPTSVDEVETVLRRHATAPSASPAAVVTPRAATAAPVRRPTSTPQRDGPPTVPPVAQPPSQPQPRRARSPHSGSGPSPLAQTLQPPAAPPAPASSPARAPVVATAGDDPLGDAGAAERPAGVPTRSVRSLFAIIAAAVAAAVGVASLAVFGRAAPPPTTTVGSAQPAAAAGAVSGATTSSPAASAPPTATSAGAAAASAAMPTTRSEAPWRRPEPTRTSTSAVAQSAPPPAVLSPAPPPSATGLQGAVIAKPPF